MKLYLRSHDPHSEGARKLAEHLGIPRLRHHHSNFRPSPQKLLINWGASELPRELRLNTLNKPEAVSICTNKFRFFELLSLVPELVLVPHTISQNKVIEWLSQGHTVCARQKLNASGGEGLILFDHTDKFVEAPLWTFYVKKKEEYRIHIMNGEVIVQQRKALKDNFEGEQSVGSANIDHRIRNLANGYIFARNELEVPQMVIDQSILCVNKLGLDFGAVDIIWNEKKQQSFILEVNSAPGLEGSTIDDYAEGFKRYLG